MKRLLATCLLAAVLLPAAEPRAADLRSVSVEHEDGRYKLTSETFFDAEQSELFRVLTDYDLFIKFTAAFTETRNLDPDDEGRPRFYTRMEGCVLLFCKAYIRSGHLELKPEYDIVAIADPELSNFKFARERWQLIPEEDGVVLIYDFEMEPDFWVPPVIGPYVVKRAMRSGGISAVDRIEALAQGKEPEQ